MADTTSDPPYPSDTRARGWRFEIDTETVKASDTWLRAKTGALRGALLLLWAEAWQQTPCGTLPNDDELISLLIDMPMQTFLKHRVVLLRGWSLANDGRLYHDTITKRVLSMLDKRASDAERAATRRARKRDSDGSPPDVHPESRVTHTGATREFDTKHQAPSTSNTPPTPRKRGTVHDFPPGFEAFWAAYPRKIGKDAAAKAFAKLKPDEALLHAVLTAVKAQAASEQWTKDEGQFIPHASTWLNGRRWEDEIRKPNPVDDIMARAH